MDDKTQGNPLVPDKVFDLSGNGQSPQSGVMSAPKKRELPDTGTDPYAVEVGDHWPHRLKALAERANGAAMKWAAKVEEERKSVRDSAIDRCIEQQRLLARKWDEHICRFKEALALHNERQARKAADADIASEALLAYKVELAIRGGKPDGPPTVLYDAPRKKFLLWGGRWKLDTLGLAFSVVGDQVQSLTPAAKWNNAKTYNAILQHIKAAPGMVTDGSEWDADHMLLGTPGGVVDLSSGELREYRLGDRVTKSTAVTPAPGRPDRWLQFLAEATGKDAEFILALQKFCGYCLTGQTDEQVLTFIHGLAGTGKGTLVRVLFGILGDYAVEAAESVIEKRNTTAHPTELIALKGARLVTVSETGRGREWNDKRVQQFTGDDPITARGMQENFTTFLPTFKLVIVGNYAPKMASVTGAMKRRLRVFPFNCQPAEVDTHLKAKLREEWPQILQWMVEGCLVWQREGLGRFTAEKLATEAFFENEDVVSDWLDELCERVEGAFTSYRDLLESYNSFRRHAGMFPVEQKLLMDDLSDRGFERSKGGKGTRGMRGIKVVRSLEYRLSTCEPQPVAGAPDNVVDLQARKGGKE